MSDKEKAEPQIIYVQQPMNERNDEAEIDLNRVWEIFLEKKNLAAKLSVGMAALFLGASFILPKTYTSTTLVQTGANSTLGGGSAAALMSAMTGTSGNTVVENYIALMQSRTVIEPIVENLEYEDGILSSAEEKKAHAVADATKWAEKNLKIENAKGTNLISITASAKTPEKAQEIAQAVADNFLDMQTNLNQKQQSLVVKFLGERIESAREDAVEAGKKFAEYQKEHGVYAPSDQAQLAVKRMDAYREALVDLRTKQEAAKAERDTATQQLAALNASSLDYQINDNETVSKMRQQIADKEVSLVALRQKYTEEHPSIRSAQAELEQLQTNLSREVNAIVASETASMSPQQSSLIGKKLNAEVNLNVAKVSETAIGNKYAEEQKNLDEFPETVRNYIDLQQEVTMKQTIYTNLVTQAEAAKLQEAKDSMDIQIVDSANLPLEDMPSSPKKGRNTAIGFMLGLLFCLGRAFYLYWQENKREARGIS